VRWKLVCKLSIEVLRAELCKSWHHAIANIMLAKQARVNVVLCNSLSLLVAFLLRIH